MPNTVTGRAISLLERAVQVGSSSGQRQGNLFGGVVSPVVEREISVSDPIGESLKTAVAGIDPDSTSPKQAL